MAKPSITSKNYPTTTERNDGLRGDIVNQNGTKGFSHTRRYNKKRGEGESAIGHVGKNIEDYSTNRKDQKAGTSGQRET